MEERAGGGVQKGGGGGREGWHLIPEDSTDSRYRLGRRRCGGSGEDSRHGVTHASSPKERSSMP